jgi:hypothetical protein
MSPNYSLQRAYCLSLRWYMNTESHGGKTLTVENWRGGRKTCPSTTSSTTSPTVIDPGENPGLRDDRQVTNRLSHGTALWSMWTLFCGVTQDKYTRIVTVSQPTWLISQSSNTTEQALSCGRSAWLQDFPTFLHSITYLPDHQNQLGTYCYINKCLLSVCRTNSGWTEK